MSDAPLLLRPEDQAEAEAPPAAEATGGETGDWLWQALRTATTVEDYAAAWLPLVLRRIEAANMGAVVLGPPGRGPFRPVTLAPEGVSLPERLHAVAEKSMAERRGVAHVGKVEAPRLVLRPIGDQAEGDDRAAGTVLACPLIVEGAVHGVAGLLVRPIAPAAVRRLMRDLQWSVQSLEYALYRDQVGREKSSRDALAAAHEMLAGVVEESAFEAAAIAFVTELAEHLECERVALGFRRRNRSTVQALSHSARFGKRMNLMRRIANAMDEAIDQVSLVYYPLPTTAADESQIDAAHRLLAETSGAGQILTVPFSSNERIIGAIVLERAGDRPFKAHEIELLEYLAGVAGPVLDEKRRNDRWLGAKIGASTLTQIRRVFGPRYYGRKLALLAVVAVSGFLAFATGMYRVSADATLEGTVQRSVIAAFDGYVQGEFVRAGDLVEAGTILAQMDTRDLELEQARRLAERQELALEHSRALGIGQRAESAILMQRMAQVDAQLALLEEQIARAAIRAPFDGIVVRGDLSQQVGASLRRGDELFVIAPLDSYRVILGVDEGQIADVEVGQQGRLVLSALPDSALDLRVERMTPVAEAREGRTVFRVEAALDAPTLRLRPGMEGVAKVDVDERLLVWIWTRGLIDWIKIALWRYIP